MTEPYTAPKPVLPKRPPSGWQTAAAAIIAILAIVLLVWGITTKSVGGILFGFLALGLGYYLWKNNGGEQ